MLEIAILMAIGKIGVMDKTGAKKRRSPYAVRLSGVESL